MNEPATTPAAKTFKVSAFIAGVFIIAVVVGLGVIVNTNYQASAAKRLAADNTRILGIIAAVTGCNPEESLDVCSAKVRAANIAEGTRRIIEVDCITRRALAGLPAPDPTRFCTEQTPPTIYPGVPQ